MSETPHGDKQFRVASLTRTVYLPGILFAIGQGAATPVIALVALDLGASRPRLVRSWPPQHRHPLLRPSGWPTRRPGRRAMGNAHRHGKSLPRRARDRVRAFPPRIPVIVFLMGGAWWIWALARLAYATEATPLRHRGRVMSMVGGTIRIGEFIGPLIGGLLIIPFGLVAPFFMQAALAVAAAVTLGLAPSPHGGNGGNGPRLDASGDTRASTDPGDGGFGGGDASRCCGRHARR